MRKLLFTVVYIRSISCRLVQVKFRSIYRFALKNCYPQSFIRLISDSLRSMSDRSRFALRKQLFTVVYKIDFRLVEVVISICIQAFTFKFRLLLTWIDLRSI